jgi:hypothetical protein
VSADTVRRLAPARAGSAPRRPGLRVLPGGRVRPPRAPFVVLVLLVLGAGLVGLLLLNTGLQHSSFELRDLERETRLLRDQHAALTHEVTRLSAPDELAVRAGALGMEPAGEREYLVLDGGTRAALEGDVGADEADGAAAAGPDGEGTAEAAP